MLKTDKTALICDMAETYHIYDFKGLPARTSAALAFGLRENSRIKMKLAGARRDEKTLLLALIADSLSFVAWTKTEKAKSNTGRPKSLYELLTRDPAADMSGYDTPEEFWAARNKYIGGT